MAHQSGSFDQAELGEGGDAVIEADFLDDAAVHHLEHGRADEAPSRGS